jgi:hexosaminidase
VPLVLVALLPACAARGRPQAQVSTTAGPALLPAPASLAAQAAPGFTVTATTPVVVVAGGDDRATHVGQFLADLIGIAVGPAPPRVETALGTAPAGSIVLVLEPGEAGAESYELVSSAEGVRVSSPSAAGLFYGVQTLRQLMPPWIEYEAVREDASRTLTVPAVRISDRPRFAWRGAMLDVARHFFDVADVRRYVDLLALHKINRLHLHLSDDQGWRIEIASWPRLASHGGTTEVGGGPGGFYTQAQYAEIVAYAAERFITVVPEIDMPGHTNAALASYAELNCDDRAPSLYTGIEVGFSAFCVDKPITYRFIDDVVREIAAMTPGAWVHIGGDEVKTLAPAQYTQFIERVQDIVHAHGKQMIGWDEISPARLRPDTIVQHWRPDQTPAAAVAQGVKLILSPADRVYLDMRYDQTAPIGLNWAGFVSVRHAYDWDPATALDGVSEASILGVEAPIWTETMASIRDVEWLAFPRLAVAAEIAWSPRAARGWDDLRMRLGAQAPRWTALGVNFHRSPEIPWR